MSCFGCCLRPPDCHFLSYSLRAIMLHSYCCKSTYSSSSSSIRHLRVQEQQCILAPGMIYVPGGRVKITPRPRSYRVPRGRAIYSSSLYCLLGPPVPFQWGRLQSAVLTPASRKTAMSWSRVLVHSKSPDTQVPSAHVHNVVPGTR